MKKILVSIAGKMEDSFIKQIILRLSSNSPAFFKKMRNWSAAIGAVLGSAVAALQTHSVPDFKYENIILIVLQFMTAFFAGVAVTASTPSTDPNLIGGDVKGNVVQEAKEKGIVTGTTTDNSEKATV